VLGVLLGGSFYATAVGCAFSHLNELAAVRLLLSSSMLIHFDFFDVGGDGEDASCV
jgi:hypothetical protein